MTNTLHTNFRISANNLELNPLIKEAYRVYSDIRMKVSEKGAVSIYSMGRFPVTL